jgi:hypothetical protein
LRRQAILLAILALMLGGCVGVYGVTSNDSGGIIPWSPDNELAALDIAQKSCARNDRFAVITSVHREYGDYIGFRCQYEEPARQRPISQLR